MDFMMSDFQVWFIAAVYVFKIFKFFYAGIAERITKSEIYIFSFEIIQADQSAVMVVQFKWRGFKSYR